MNIEEQIKIVKNMLLHAGTQLLDYEAIAIETLLTAYEKEKEDNKKKSIVIIEYQDLYEKLEDKIKAKIIEIKNRPVKDEFITATRGKLNTIIDIESLLDKEE